MITNFIQLDFNKENDLKVPSVQYDSGSRFVKIKLQQNKVPFEINGYRVTVVANKVDGTEIMNDCTILDGANGIVQFEITEQFNAVEGVVDCQLKLFKDEILLTSMPFSISVVKSVSTKEIVSSNELKTLVNALGEVQNIDNRFAQTNAQLSKKANSAEVVKKGYGTLSDFDEETRRAIQGMSSSEINAVLGRGNVTNYNLAINSVDVANANFIDRIGENLYDKNLFDDTGFYNGSGLFDTGFVGTWGNSGFIPVQNGETYTVSATGTTTLFDENLKFLQSISGSTFTINNEKAVFLSIAIRVTQKDTFRIVRGTVDNPNAFCKYEIKDLIVNESNAEWLVDELNEVKSKETLSDVINVKHINLHNNQNMTLGKYVDKTTGTLKSISGGAVTDFIEVVEGETYSSSYKFTQDESNFDVWGKCYYDEHYNFVENVVATDGVVTVPTGKNIKYIRITIQYVNDNYAYHYKEFMFVEGTTLPTNYVDYNDTECKIIDGSTLDKAIDSKFKGNVVARKWCVLGDSITNYSQAYHYHIAKEVEGLSVVKVSRDGAWLSRSDNATMCICDELDNIPDDVDYITVAGGTNDRPTDLGTMDSRDVTTLYGACHYIFSTLIDRFGGKAKIVIMTPIPRSVAVMPFLKQKSAIIKEVAEYYALPVLDLTTDCNGLNCAVDRIVTEFIPDKLHPNSEGHRIFIAPLVKEKLGL